MHCNCIASWWTLLLSSPFGGSWVLLGCGWRLLGYLCWLFAAWPFESLAPPAFVGCRPWLACEGGLLSAFVEQNKKQVPCRSEGMLFTNGFPKITNALTCSEARVCGSGTSVLLESSSLELKSERKTSKGPVAVLQPRGTIPHPKHANT